MSEPSATHALQVGGTLVPGRHVYIARPEDQEVLDLLLAGEYCNILTSRQMGKSSLMAHVAQLLDERKIRVAQVDLQDLGTPQSLDDWYQGLLVSIARDLDVRVDVRQWWSSSAWPTPNQRLIAFFREIIAAQIEQPIVVFVDEIDQTLKLSYTDDFFAAIRSMYNQRGKEPAFARLAFCLVGVASPNELIKDKRTTPYNVGKTIELRDFDPQRDELSELHRAVCPSDPQRGAAIVAAVLTWTGGHPYLTASLCSRFARQTNAPVAVDEWVQREFVRHDVMPEDEKVHFQRVTEYLSQRARDPISTLQLYRRIRRGRPEPDRSSQQHIDLKLSGVVKRDSQGRLVVRNRIYERIFTDEWAQAIMPPAERRVIVARVGAAVSLAALCLLAVAAGWQWNRNQDQRAQNGVAAVLDAAPDRVRDQIQIVAPVRTRAIPSFRQAMDDQAKPDQQRLHAALALAMLAEVPYEFLLDAIPKGPSGEVDNLVAAFRPVKETVLPQIAKRFAAAKTPDEQVRLATVALHLGDYGLAKTLSVLEADPTRRTAFIHGFPAWHGDLADMVPMVRDLDVSRRDEADFRSALCSALGLVPLTDSQSAPPELVERLKAWYGQALDGATHSAAGRALQRWNQGTASITVEDSPSTPRDWFVVNVGKAEATTRIGRLTMIKVPKGEFQMGSDRGEDNEKPVHHVRLAKDFYLSDREVTVGMFKAFMAAETELEKPRDYTSVSQMDDCPVQKVSWLDAVLFCNWLSREHGRTPCYTRTQGTAQKPVETEWQCNFEADGFRLPTEAEWEYACRARAQTEFSFGDDEALLDEYAFYLSNSKARTWPGGEKLPNGFGLFDLHGNAWEWCWDRSANNYYAQREESDPRGPPGVATYRVIRGGGWRSIARDCRAAFRSGYVPGGRGNGLGFRVAAVPSGQ